MPQALKLQNLSFLLRLGLVLVGRVRRALGIRLPLSYFRLFEELRERGKILAFRENPFFGIIHWKLRTGMFLRMGPWMRESCIHGEIELTQPIARYFAHPISNSISFLTVLAKGRRGVEEGRAAFGAVHDRVGDLALQDELRAGWRHRLQQILN